MFDESCSIGDWTSVTRQELLDGLRAVLEAETQFTEEGPSSEFGQKWLARGIALLRQYDRRQGLQFEM